MQPVTRPALWRQVPDEQWDNWQWQAGNRLAGVADLEAAGILLAADERRALTRPGRFRVDVTPYFCSLLDPSDPSDPLRRQVIPTVAEDEPYDGAALDPLAEDTMMPVPGIVHRYPDRVGLFTTTECASYCRFCTRSRVVGDATVQFGRDQYATPLAYIAAHPEVRDVLLTGGDALMLSDRRLSELLDHIRAIPHVEVVRISTRVPIFLPQRITSGLLEVLRTAHPLWMNLNVNHPRELTPASRAAITRLADAGIPLGSQSVLLAGINDCPNLMRVLFTRLVALRVRPYYLYLCDPVAGSSHMRTPVAVGEEVIEYLRGHISGYAVPQLVIDAAGGGGKVPVPEAIVSRGPRVVVVRNFEGLLSAYPEPRRYTIHDPEQCAFCREASPSRGLTGLLRHERATIVPADWREEHQQRVLM